MDCSGGRDAKDRSGMLTTEKEREAGACPPAFQFCLLWFQWIFYFWRTKTRRALITYNFAYYAYIGYYNINNNKNNKELPYICLYRGELKSGYPEYKK